MSLYTRKNRQTYRPGSPPWLQNVKDILHDRFSQPIKLTELAETAGVHHVHLCRAFRQHYLCSLGDYQRRLRVEHSSKLLRATNLSLVEVALAAGFSDQAHFSRVFKKPTRMTPAEFRQLSR
jgi:AraC family transcriptional regulator